MNVSEYLGIPPGVITVLGVLFLLMCIAGGRNRR